MAETNVRVIVGAVDQASNVLKNIGKNIENTLSKQAKTSVSGLNQATSGLQGAFGTLARVAGTVGLAIAGAGAVIAGAALAARPFISAAVEMQNAMMGLMTVARSFGIEATSATDAARALAEDGLMSVNEAAAGLKNLLATGFSLPQAIDLMNTFKDTAAFNRQGMLGFGEAIVGATQGIKNQNSIMVDNAGITKNLSNIIKEQGGSMQDLSEVTSDAGVRMKLYNGLMKEGSIFTGDAEKASQTLGGQLSRLGTASFLLKAAIGDALSPAVEMLAGLMRSGLVNALAWVQSHMFGLQTAALVVGTTLLQLANIVIGIASIIGAAFKSIFTLSFEPLKQAIKGVATNMVSTTLQAQDKMKDIAMKSAGAQTDAYEKSAKKIADASSKKKDKLTKDLQKETESFEREMLKREKNFKESLADMIYAHIEKRDSLKKDLEEENKDFSQKMTERIADFKEKMEDMKVAHEEKVNEINKQIKEEDVDFQETLDEKKISYDENMQEMKDSHGEKVAEIEKQIEKEAAKGTEVDQERLDELRANLATEIVEYDAKVAKSEAQYLKETTSLKTEHDRRLLDYQERLAKEEAENLRAKAKAEADNIAETEKIKAENAKRLADFQEKIKAEEDVLNKHQADVAVVKDKAKEDDITRLKRQFEEEKAEATADHERKMKDMKEQGGEEGAEYGGALKGAIDTKLRDIESSMDSSGQTAGENFAKGIGEGAKKAARDMIDNFFNGLKDKLKSLAEKLRNFAVDKLGMSELFFSNEFIESRHQTGGVVPGAVGQEVPILAHGGERVIPNGISGSGGGGSSISFNVNIGLYGGSETEKRNIAKELYSALVQVAQSQNKSVIELMGG